MWRRLGTLLTGVVLFSEKPVPFARGPHLAARVDGFAADRVGRCDLEALRESPEPVDGDPPLL